MPCTWVDRYRAPHSVSCSVCGSGSGVRDDVVLGIGGARVRTPVSNDMDRNQQAQGAGSG